MCAPVDFDEITRLGLIKVLTSSWLLLTKVPTSLIGGPTLTLNYTEGRLFGLFPW